MPGSAYDEPSDPSPCQAARDADELEPWGYEVPHEPFNNTGLIAVTSVTISSLLAE